MAALAQHYHSADMHGKSQGYYQSIDKTGVMKYHIITAS
jgi:hypothetical protein